MKDTPLISVIVPVYNVEKYLSRCLESLVNQSYDNIEIIVVDDGSTDNSPQIIKKFLNKNDNMRVITQVNQGVSVARNTGLKNAKGKYIMFTDGDDYVDKDFCLAAYTSLMANHSEIVIFNIHVVNNEKSYLINLGLREGQVSKEQALSTTINASFPFNKIYRASLFKNISYPVNKLYEDIFITYKIINKAKSVSYVDKALYYYVQRNNSTVHHHTSESLTDYFESSQQLFDFFKQNYPALSRKMVTTILKGSFYFLAYANNNSPQHLLKLADENLRKLPLPKSLRLKWLLTIRIYRVFPRIGIALFKFKQKEN